MKAERSGRHRRRVAGAGLLLVTVSVTGFVTGSRAGATGETRSLVGVASASGMRATYTVPDYVVVSEFFDGGGPVAQANVDTTGKATGFGSLPYPGENAVTAPGLLTFATGVPVPGYPFYVRADHPVTPTAEAKDPSGTYSLKASADQGKAAGSAQFLFGGASPVTRSTADSTGVLDGEGRLTMTAVGVSEGLSFGDGTLKISSVVSRSVSTYEPGAAKPTTKTDLQIQGAKVGDQPVTIDRDGVHPSGQTVPVPIGSGSDSINQALAQAGITVKTIAGNDVEGGQAGDVLEVTWKHTIPVEGNPKGTFIYRIGGASTFILFGAAGPGLPDIPPPVDNVPADRGVAAPAGPAEGSTGGAPAASLNGGAGAGGSSGALSAGYGNGPASVSGGGAVPAGGAAVAAGDTSGLSGASGDGSGSLSAAPAPGLSTPAILARDVRGTTKFFYAVIGVAGAMLLASSALWRLKGVKAAWTS
ncbi:MAG: hypothetical protein AB1679_32555 [Actinomycetota bacterium]